MKFSGWFEWRKKGEGLKNEQKKCCATTTTSSLTRSKTKLGFRLSPSSSSARPPSPKQESSPSTPRYCRAKRSPGAVEDRDSGSGPTRCELSEEKKKERGAAAGRRRQRRGRRKNGKQATIARVATLISLAISPFVLCASANSESTTSRAAGAALHTARKRSRDEGA